jgi:hypothetical protein
MELAYSSQEIGRTWLSHSPHEFKGRSFQHGTYTIVLTFCNFTYSTWFLAFFVVIVWCSWVDISSLMPVTQCGVAQFFLTLHIFVTIYMCMYMYI